MRQDARVSVNTVDHRTCRGCGARFERRPWALDHDVRASPECWHARSEVLLFGAEHPEGPGRPGDLDQLVRDAYGAQHAGEPTPEADAAAGLLGLHLALERGMEPGAVRAARERLAEPDGGWPRFEPPSEPARTTVADVLAEALEAGSAAAHEAAVRRWAAEVWASWEPRHADVADLAGRLLPDEAGG